MQIREEIEKKAQKKGWGEMHAELKKSTRVQQIILMKMINREFNEPLRFII